MAGTFSSPRAGVALATLFLLPAIASAFQPLVTDDTGTQGAGGNQVEAAYNRTVDEAPGTRDVTHEVPLVCATSPTEKSARCPPGATCT